jgi:hypothetical protein
MGGPNNLAAQEFYLGINDALGADPDGRPFDPKAFTTYDNWTNSPSPHRASIARGQMLFNTFPITITGVAGLNDIPGLSTVNGTCTTCHDSPNVGNHSVPLAIDIGVTDYPRASSPRHSRLVSLYRPATPLEVRCKPPIPHGLWSRESAMTWERPKGLSCAV